MERVLISEENPQAQEVLTTYFRDLFEVRTCRLEDASTVAADFLPHVFIISLSKLFPIKSLMQEFTKNSTASQIRTLCLVPDTNPRTLEFLYECGVDDSLVKPVDFNQLYWKVKSLIRLTKSASPTIVAAEDNPLMLGDLKILPELNEAQIQNMTFKLTERETKLLVALIKYQNRLLTRDVLRLLVWSGEKISSRSIDAQVSKLKKKIPYISLHLEGVYGKGYVWRSKELYKKASGSTR